MSTLQELYLQALATPSDISEHLPTLYGLARECDHVTEMGTRAGWSTRALLYAQPEELVCYDLVRQPEIDRLEAAAREAGRPRFRFLQADVLEAEIEETDLLFIDTFHVYDQTREELARHAGKVRKYLVFHDTTTFGESGEAAGERGIWPAIEEFVRGCPQWQIAARMTHNNGLTIVRNSGLSAIGSAHRPASAASPRPGMCANLELSGDGLVAPRPSPPGPLSQKLGEGECLALGLSSSLLPALGKPGTRLPVAGVRAEERQADHFRGPDSAHMPRPAGGADRGRDPGSAGLLPGDTDHNVGATSSLHGHCSRPRGAAPAWPHVAIVVPVHNALEYVQRSLTTIARTCPGAPLIVVDDCSAEETHRWLCRFLFEETRGTRTGPHLLLRNDRQQLFTRTVNRGIRWVDTMRRAADPLPMDFVAVVNTDCDLQENWLKALLLGMEDPQVGLVGFSDRADGEEPALREMREPDFIVGHCLLLRMKMVEEIGVFCETDTDGRDSPGLAALKGQAHVGSDRGLSWRANRAGWKTLYTHCQLCYHPGGGSWHNDLAWLSGFDLQPLWPPCDRLENRAWVEESAGAA